MEIKVTGFSVPEVENPFSELPFANLREFQKEFIENVDKFNVLFLSAPTGSGKTLCFEYLCKKNPPTLLVYPTTALMVDQERQLKKHGLNVFKLDSNTLGDIRGYARSRELLAFFQKHDVIITNPDIISAILHHMYINPEDDLIRIFTFFHYIIYDEFHVFKELEISDIILQIMLFLGSSNAKVILSSATPSIEVIKLLKTVMPEWKIGNIDEKGSNKGSLVRYNTTVHVSNEKFREKVGEIVNSCIEKNFKTLVICNSNKFARELYNSLISEGYNEHVTKDTGDETRGEIKADLSRLITISTSKSEVGVDYPLDVIVIDVPPDVQSFIQRFGRISRKKDGIAFIFVKTLFELDTTTVEYHRFIEFVKDYFLEKKISEKNLKSTIEFRAYLVIDKYRNSFEHLSTIFHELNWNKYDKFFKELKNVKLKLSEYGIENLRDLDFVTKFLEDYKTGLSLLRGQSITSRIRYQRGGDWTFTSYDLLHSLNNYDIDIRENYLELLTPSDTGMIYSLDYNKNTYDFYRFNNQLKDDILKAWGKLEERGLVHRRYKNLIQELLQLDLRKVIIPEEIVLKDGRKIDVRKYVSNKLPDNFTISSTII